MVKKQMSFRYAEIYLEDLYVLPEYRGLGYGKGLLHKLAQTAGDRRCGRLEWWCLDVRLKLPVIIIWDIRKYHKVC